MPGLTVKDLVVWGWLRLLLGAAQVGLSAAAVFALFAGWIVPDPLPAHAFAASRI